MSSEFHVNRPLPGCYIVSEALLRKCVRLVDRFSEADCPPDTATVPTDISITFKDGRVINSTIPDNVLGDSLIQSTKINAITISNSDKACITFRRSNFPIYLKISGNRSTALAFEQELINQLFADKAWYDCKYYEHFVFSVLAIAFVSVALLVSASTLILIGDRSPFVKNAAMALSVTFLVMVFIIVVVPSNIVFDFGEGARKRKASDFILSSIIVVAIVGIAVNVFTSWVTELSSQIFAPSGTAATQSAEAPVSASKPPVDAVSKPTEAPIPIPKQSFHLPDQINEVTDQDIRQSAYLLNQNLKELDRQYYNEQIRITGSTDQVASEQLALDEKLNREFRQQYEADFLKLDAELARRLKIDDDRYKSFPSERISAGVISNAGDHLVRLANQLP